MPCCGDAGSSAGASGLMKLTFQHFFLTRALYWAVRQILYSFLLKYFKVRLIFVFFILKKEDLTLRPTNLDPLWASRLAQITRFRIFQLGIRRPLHGARAPA